MVARFHRVPGNADAVRVAEAWRRAAGSGAGRAGGPEKPEGREKPGEPERRGPGIPGRGGMSMDQIALRGLRVRGYHGVLDSERRDGQEFLVDAVLWLDTAAAAAGDDLALTVDYAALADRLAAIVAGPRYGSSRRWPSAWPTRPWRSSWSARWRSPCTSRRPRSGTTSRMSR